MGAGPINRAAEQFRAHGFCQIPKLLSPKTCADLLRLLDEYVYPTLRVVSDPIPDWTMTNMQHNGDELLPKVQHNKTAFLARRNAKEFRAVTRTGIIDMLQSASFISLVNRIAGKNFRKTSGVQVLCYEPGDYVGPHNDHFPEEPQAKNGYVDVHLSLCTDSVHSQQLVYTRRKHFSQVCNLAQNGLLTAYHLPSWHYVTPLVAKVGEESKARRWVLMATFVDEPSAKAASTARARRRAR